MPIVWNLKKWLAVQRDVYRASELQTLLVEKAGVRLSLQAVSALINGQPSALRLPTIQALCNALDCHLSEFCEVLPDATGQIKKKISNGPSKLYGLPQGSGSIFPDPKTFKAPNKPAKPPRK